MAKQTKEAKKAAAEKEGRLTAIAEVLTTAKIAWTEEDLEAADEYLGGPDTCERYDRLSGWVRMIVDEVHKVGAKKMAAKSMAAQAVGAILDNPKAGR